MSADDPTRSAYARAGVDVDAGERAVALMRSHVASASRPEVMSGIGGFAGFFDAAALKDYRHPVLVTSTDGVGTKVAIAAALGVHDTIGIDLVAMLVDDLVVVGAEPLFVTDYIACGVVVPQRIAAIVAGVAEGCRQSGAALVGGETAEHPGLLAADEFDLAGATTGVVERDRILGPERVERGDRVLALASSGLHSNGYSLVRHVLLERAKLRLDAEIPELRRTLGEELLTPTRIYARHVLDVVAATEVHAMSHITGGGVAANIARVLPEGLRAVIDRSTWALPPIFGLVQRVGEVGRADLEEALNVGVGMALILPAASLDEARRVLAEAGVEAWDCGEIHARQPGQEACELVGDYRGE
ncbi:MAG: phosphoribosylformylglycinamidine cyclo-ligase [Propionibacteriaceae bacterium]|jgi:phosphoribosylformylglycinamidine cyclo-ligase|nr:phosphoribosylformylglycinamidine cyclo-ligase [Propionibacteriaceae bacterium]